MKKLTRKLALLLVLALLLSTCLFTLSACDNDDDDDNDGGGVKTVETLNGMTPLEAYRAAEAKMETTENAELSGIIGMVMEVTGEGLSINQGMDMNVLMRINGETFYSNVSGETTGLQSAEMLEETWLVDGVYYEHIREDGAISKTKTPMTYDEYMEMGDDGNDQNDFFIDLESGLLDGAKFRKDGKTYYVDVKLTGEQIKQYAADLVSDYEDDVEFDTLDYRMSFNENGELTGFRISFSGETTESGMTMSMEVTMRLDVRYNCVGTINPPTDAALYELIVD